MSDPINDTINVAEEYKNPVDRVVEEIKANPAAPFEPDFIAYLAKLKSEASPAWHSARARLKRAGVHISGLERLIDDTNGDESGSSRTIADVIVELASGLDLFHAKDETAYADVEINGHRETWRLTSKAFRNYLQKLYRDATGRTANKEAVNAAVADLDASANIDGPLRTPFVRVGFDGEKYYLDLGDETWRAVEIDRDGWRVIDRPPVRFRRASSPLALPLPQPGGSMADLRRFLNVRSDDDFRLAVAWLLAALRPTGPYPVLVLAGEQGSAKSTFTAVLRRLTDPKGAPLRSLSRNDEEMFITATNGHVLAFDNLSHIPTLTADTLCRLSTGGGFAKRMLYSDAEEQIFDAMRPIILNGIEDVVSRSDLADRCIFLVLEPIADDQRKPELEIWTAFDAAQPKLLGALLSAVSTGMRELPNVKLASLPRLADFAIWATACEKELWPAGGFMVAYEGNRAQAVTDVIDADPVAAALRDFMAERDSWSGTAQELRDALTAVVPETTKNAKGWPVDGRALAGKLRRAAAFLRKLGISLDKERLGKARTRVISISRTDPRKASSASSALSAGNEINGLGRTTTNGASSASSSAVVRQEDTPGPPDDLWPESAELDGTTGTALLPPETGLPPSTVHSGAETTTPGDADDFPASDDTPSERSGYRAPWLEGKL